MMYQLILPIVFAASVLARGPIALPSNFKTCSRNSPMFDECLRSAIQSAIGVLVRGSKALGVLPIDPLQVTSLQIHQGSGPVAINLDFEDLLIHGIKDVTVKNVKTNINDDEKSISIDLSTNKNLELAGKYTINGQVLVLPISGTGKSHIKFDGVNATITLTGNTVEKNGVTYLTFKSINFVLIPDGMKMNFENLFNGDKALGDNMNKFLNENWMVVYSELQGAIQKGFAKTFVDLTHQIFKKVPYDSIFPQ